MNVKVYTPGVNNENPVIEDAYNVSIIDGHLLVQNEFGVALAAFSSGSWIRTETVTAQS